MSEVNYRAALSRAAFTQSHRINAGGKVNAARSRSRIEALADALMDSLLTGEQVRVYALDAAAQSWADDL